jgi:hypothetical protein
VRLPPTALGDPNAAERVLTVRREVTEALALV